MTFTGNFAGGRAHCERAVALYDPAEHRALATRFGQDAKATARCWRALACWTLGYPQIAAADAAEALRDAREIGHAATLMLVLTIAPFTHLLCGDYAATNSYLNEVVTLSEEKGALYWKALAVANQGCVLAQTS
jgi:hypothetical protein